MIDAIKIPVSNWYTKDIKSSYLYPVKINNLEVNKIDIETVMSNAKQYFYQEEYQVPSTELELERIINKLQAEEKQIDYLKFEGYEVENLTVEEVVNLTKTKTRTVESRGSNLSRRSIDNKIDRLKEHHDGMYIYGVTQQGTLSINDLYKGSYSVGENKEQNTYSNFQSENILKLNGLEHTQGNEWAVSKLLTMGLDVSQRNIIKVQNIQAAVDGLNKEEEARKMAEDIEQGQVPGNRPLMEDEKILYIEKDMQDIIDDITRVDEDDIRDTILEGKDITIGNLRETMYRNTGRVLQKGKVSQEEIASISKDTQSNMEPERLNTKIEQTKEQLSEIRARLNTEAAIRISEKMPLESTELSKIAKELMNIEDIKVEEAILKVDIPETLEIKEMIKDTLKVTYQIGRHKEFVSGLEMKAADQGSIEEIGKVINSYEDNFLQTEKRFGETTEKVEGQIEGFLEVENIPVTEENKAAAKALISNQLEITSSNIEKAAKMISKVNAFLQEMTPERAALLIKEGVNPYKASINDVLEWSSLERLPALQNTIAEAIIGLESDKQITETQKQSLLGLYRIIGGVLKNKEQIVGYMFKNELPLTVEKLKEATEYAKQKEHITVAVDDAFGELEEIKYKETTANQMIEESRKENNKLLDIISVLENTNLSTDKSNISKVAELNSMIYPFIKSQIKRELGKFEGIGSLSPSMMEKLETLKNIEPEVIEMMNKQQIPLTIANLHWMQKLVENPNLYAELIQQEGFLKESLPENIETLVEELEALRKEIKDKKEYSAEKGDILKYREYKKLEEVIGVQRQLIDKEGLYQIPFVIDGQTKLINLYINKESKKINGEMSLLKAVITYQTKEIGTVVAKLSIEEGQLSYNVQGETLEATRKLSSYSKQLEVMLQGIGYLVTEGEYGVGRASNVIINPEQIHKRGDSYFEEVI